MFAALAILLISAAGALTIAAELTPTTEVKAITYTASVTCAALAFICGHTAIKRFIGSHGSEPTHEVACTTSGHGHNG